MEDVTAIELHVLTCMLADCEAGGLRTLEYYLRRFEDHEPLVRRCYERLRDGRATC